MGTSQKNISLPRDFTEEFQKLFNEQKEALKTIGINSVSELLRVLANLGKPKLLEILATLPAPSQTHSDTNESSIAQSRKPYKNRRQSEK